MSYVQISREDLEDWLKTNFGTKWNRDKKFQGVYLIHLSDSVAVKLTSSIGRGDQAVAKGRGSMNLSLVSRLIDRAPLNVKDRDRKSFKRTMNWKTTWLAGVRHWEQVYQKRPDFYDAIGRGDDPNQGRSQAPSRSQAQPQSDDRFIQRLRLLWLAANKDRNEANKDRNKYVKDFAKNVGNNSKKGREPSGKQVAFAEKQFRIYRIPENPQGQASRPKSDPYDEMARRLQVNRSNYRDSEMDTLERTHQETGLVGIKLEQEYQYDKTEASLAAEDEHNRRRDDHQAWRDRRASVVRKHAARKVARRYGES